LVTLGRRGIIHGALLAAVLGLLSPMVVLSVTEEEIEAAEKDVARVEEERADAEDQRHAVAVRQDALVLQLAAIDGQRFEALGRLREVQRQLETLELEVYDINQSIHTLNLGLAGATEGLQRKARSLYKASRTTLLETVVGADSFADALDRAMALQRVLDRNLEGLEALRLSRREVQLRTADLQARLDRVGELKTEATKIEAELAERAEEHRGLIFKAEREEEELKGDIHGFDDEAAALTNRVAILRDILRLELEELERKTRVQAIIEASPQVTIEIVAGSDIVATGPYIWPLPGFITSEFFLAGPGYFGHSGIDIANAMYTPILAANDGLVLEVGYAVPGNRYASYGMMVIIAHSKSEETLYAHLDDIDLLPTVEAGQFVSRGQTIGYVGVTGFTTGPHLHFEYRVNGTPLDPRILLGYS
jgi:murein DD-endopeptidase MepM/ murein hydrolase activator NlpD